MCRKIIEKPKTSPMRKLCRGWNGNTGILTSGITEAIGATLISHKLLITFFIPSYHAQLSTVIISVAGYQPYSNSIAT